MSINNMFFILNLNILKRFFYGIIIGASMMIPGLSGGTAAIILGVFYEIIKSASKLLTDFKKSISYLLPYALGGIAGIFIICFPLKFVISIYKIYFNSIIIGIILGSAKCFLPKSKFKINYLFWITLGATPVILQQVLNQNFVSSQNLISLILVGMLSSIALILPGISLTNILISFGYYEKVINSITNFDLEFISFYILSLLFGIIISIKLILNLYEKYTEKINLVLLGMVLISILQINPTLPAQNQIIPCTLFFIAGVCISLFISSFEK